ncbi:MAG TPA: excinuclease ABC subunit UvrC [Stenomitos sp.]
MQLSDLLQSQLATLPTNPGVYLMHDAAGTILYVGKAINLRNRVRSYFREDKGHSPKVRMLVRQVDHLETISTDTEVEALVLENTLIKQHKPYFNILLKDDKTYPWLKLTTNEAYPRLIITRKRLHDGARYFGPYPDTGAMYATMRLIKQLFPLRQRPKPQFKDRPCLNYAIGRCLGPCQGLVSPEEYRQVVDKVIAFLEGRHKDLLRDLKAQMAEASEALDFERAAKARDAIQAITRLMEDQKVVAEKESDQDVLGIALDEVSVALQLFEVREGKLLGRKAFMLDRNGFEAAEILSAFLSQYYAGTDRLPKEILLAEPVADAEVVASWLSARRGSKVLLTVPQRGDKLKLLEMVTYNAQQALEQERLKRWAAVERGPQKALSELAAALGLDELPRRIEGYDIAHVQGSDTVASMVVFVDGAPAKSEYRRFKIKSVEGVDDFASMREVIRRRFKHLAGGDREEASWPMPDLVLIDGGKGQLASALESLDELGVEVPIFGLAKQFEEIYLPGRRDPIRLSKRSAALHLIQRVRDEAHRFANTFHGKLRGKRMTRSALDDVPGIGEKRKLHLLKTLGSVEAMRAMSVEELAERGSLPAKVAAELYQRLHPAMTAPLDARRS